MRKYNRVSEHQVFAIIYSVLFDTPLKKQQQLQLRSLGVINRWMSPTLLES